MNDEPDLKLYKSQQMYKTCTSHDVNFHDQMHRRSLISLAPPAVSSSPTAHDVRRSKEPYAQAGIRYDTTHLSLRVPARAAQPCLCRCHGQRPVNSTSRVKLRKVRTKTTWAKVPTVGKVMSTMNVTMMPATTRNSSPSNIPCPAADAPS